jgi:2-polyprenyl-3-methyl-5-hydroxy-6-metoxy-1,4-benzoquinol methylase
MNGEINKCYLCREQISDSRIPVRDYINGESFAIATCSVCTLSMTVPIVPDNLIAKYYGTQYYGDRKAGLDKFINWLRVRRLRLLRSPGSLLDVGCGKGDFLEMMRAYGWQVTGTEFSQLYDYSLLEQKIGNHICKGDITQCNFLPQTFDVVTFWHVFEHLSKPREYLEVVRRVLKPEGRLIIEVPNFASWQAQFGGSEWFHIDVPRHTMHLTPETIRKFLEQAGFHVENLSYASFYYDVFGTLQTLLNRITRRKNLLFDSIGGRVNVREHAVDTVITILFLPIFLLIGILVYPFAVLCKKGGVITVYARKS